MEKKQILKIFKKYIYQDGDILVMYSKRSPGKIADEILALKAEMEKEASDRPSYMMGWICPRCQTVHGPFTTSCGCPPPTITRTSTDATYKI